MDSTAEVIDESTRTEFSRLWAGAGGDRDALGRIRLEGSDPMLPSSYKLSQLALITIGLSALAAAHDLGIVHSP